MKKLSWLLSVFLLFTFSSCLTYYQKQRKFNTFFEQGRFDEAEKVLSADKKSPKSKNKLLYYLNRGTVCSMLGRYEESNLYFEEAYKIVDDRNTNAMEVALSFISNPNATTYEGEDFEKLLIHYYKALNYVKLGDAEAALIECKRMNIKLNSLSDKYSSANKYKRDAFIHLLMGLIYDANYDYNNAFIAYRNAYEIYNEDYKKLFGQECPEQVKKDLLRTAHLSGFTDDVNYYEKQFGFKYQHDKNPNTGNVIVLWNNGLGPVKDEWSINFSIVKGQEGLVFFQNLDLGLSFSFQMDDKRYKESGLSNIQFIRVAFPRYLERKNVFTEASVKSEGKEYTLQLAEDINSIAFHSLQDRMFKELGTGLLRLALKKAAEEEIRKKNDGIGAAVGIVNMITEKADTRNWQSIPHSIYYTRIPVSEGKQKIVFEAKSGANNQKQVDTLNFDIQAKKTYFSSIYSLQSYTWQPY